MNSFLRTLLILLPIGLAAFILLFRFQGKKEEEEPKEEQQSKFGWKEKLRSKPVMLAAIAACIVAFLVGINFSVMITDNNKWRNLKQFVERDRIVKTHHVYEENSGFDTGRYDTRINNIFPRFLEREVVRFEQEQGAKPIPYYSTVSEPRENDVHLSSGDRARIIFDVHDDSVCDTPVRGYFGVEGGGNVGDITYFQSGEEFEIRNTGEPVLMAFCYHKTNILDYYTLLTPKINLSTIRISVND